MVATNHLNGAIKMELEYELTALQFGNIVGPVKLTFCYSKQGEAAETISMYPTDTIVAGMKLALDYFSYVDNHLNVQNLKTHPLTFALWVKERVDQKQSAA